MSVFISEAEVWPRGRETETKKKKSRGKGVSSTVFRQEPSYRVCVGLWQRDDRKEANKQQWQRQ